MRKSGRHLEPKYGLAQLIWFIDRGSDSMCSVQSVVQGSEFHHGVHRMHGVTGISAAATKRSALSFEVFAGNRADATVVAGVLHATNGAAVGQQISSPAGRGHNLIFSAMDYRLG